MEKFYEVSETQFKAIMDALKKDDYIKLARHLDLSSMSYIMHMRMNDLEVYISDPVLLHAFSFNAKMCIFWLLEHGVDVNVAGLDHSTPLMNFCSKKDDPALLFKAGARVFIPHKFWTYRYKHMRHPRAADEMISRMFIIGLEFPSRGEEYCIPDKIYQVYEIILAREAACRRACYTFIRAGILPKDLTRWMLVSFVLPSKRESGWSPLNVRMPPGFELLD